MQNLRIGFIGTGWVADVHARSLAKLPDITLAAMYNHNLPKAEAFNQKHAGGKAKCYDDWRRMLETEKLDAVYVGLPPGAHVGQTELAAERGCHLMLEKPIALTLDRAQSIAAAVRRAGVKCQIGHHMRHAMPVRKLKQLLTDGSAGRPLLMTGRFFTNALFPAWWRDPNMGGGQLVEQAIHIYDLARHFFGEPETITAFADNLFHQRFPDYRVDDVSAATIRFQNGAIASILAANCYTPHGGSQAMTVLCENVTVEFKSPNEASFAFHGGKKSEEISKDAVRHEEIKTDFNVYDELSANFLAAIRDNAPLRSSIDDGVNSLRLVLGASASAKTAGQPVRLADL
jgi:predicted dehydrogenase